MDGFEDVSVVKKANVYYEGKVTSRTVLFQNGTRKTLGIILPGTYEFSTAEKEVMEVLAGTLSVLPFESTQWSSYTAGQTFVIPKNTTFSVKCDGVVDYCCSYIAE